MWFSASFGVSLCEIAQRPLLKQRAVEKKRVKYVKEKHGPVPQQLLSTKAPDSNLHKPEGCFLVISFTVQLLLQAVIGIKISFSWKDYKLNRNGAERRSIIRHMAPTCSSICRRKERIQRMYSSCREEEKCLFWEKKHSCQRVNRKSRVSEGEVCVG